MKKRERILSVLLSSIMIFSLAAVNEVSAETTEGNVLEITMLSSDASKEAVMQELVENYNETTGKEQGISLNLECTSDIRTILDLGMENGDLPLLCDDIGNNVTYEDGGYLIPYAMLPGGQELVDEWEKKTFPYNRYNKMPGSDDIYHLTYSASGAGIVYNKDMFKEAGIVDENGEAKAPSTWKEFLEDCKILTNGTTYGAALAMQWGGFSEYGVMYNGTNAIDGAAIDIDWDNITANFQCQEAFETIAQVYQNGYCVPGAESIDNDPARSYFAEGIAGMFLGYSWDIGVFTTQYPADFDWGVCALSADDGTNYGSRLGAGLYYCPTVAALDLSEADQEKLMSVLNWLYSDEVGVALVEAGLLYPANKEFIEKADLSKLPEQAGFFMDQIETGYVETRVDDMWYNVSYDGEYGVDGPGTALMNSLLLDLCKGEITIDELTDTVNEKFSEALKEKVDDGTINPDDWK